MTLASGAVLATTVVCEAGSIRNSVAVFRSQGPASTAYSFVSYAVRGSFWSFPNVTSGTSEHDVTLLGDGRTVLLVLRLGGDGACSHPIGAYKPFFRTHSTDEGELQLESSTVASLLMWPLAGETWSTAVPIEGSGCAWPQVVTLKNGVTVLSGGRLCTEGQYGGFLWATRHPTTEARWQRFSLTYYHDQAWTGERSLLFNDTTATPTDSNRGTTCVMKHCGISSYQGLSVVVSPALSAISSRIAIV